MNSSKAVGKITEAMPEVTPKASITPQDAFRLLRYPERPSRTARTLDFSIQVAESKAAAVLAGDQKLAKLFWQVQTILKAQVSFESAFQLMKAHKFYDAWCELERCEITVAALVKHFVPDSHDRHRITYIQTMLPRWQALYPYKIFFSPELVYKGAECSICGARVSLRDYCGHEKGEIYDGEDCYHRIVEVDLLSISAVENPVQKYSVAFLASEDGSEHRDQYNYALVLFAINRLEL